jgi:hypothetical protein
VIGAVTVVPGRACAPVQVTEVVGMVNSIVGLIVADTATFVGFVAKAPEHMNMPRAPTTTSASMTAFFRLPITASSVVAGIRGGYWDDDCVSAFAQPGVHPLSI